MSSLGDNNVIKESSEVASAHPLARFFFLKTTFGLLFSLLLVTGGYFAYSSLTKESLPDLDIPNATVTTLWPGADPQTIEEQVTRELEGEIATLKGLKTYSSASFDSYSIIVVEFTADSDTTQAMQRLRDAVSDAQSSLPKDAEVPDIKQVAVDDSPIMTVTLYGDASDVALNNLANTLKDQIETIGGVNEVSLGGARDENIQILLEPDRLLALGISPTKVSQAIAVANLNQPFGEIENQKFGAVMRLEGQFLSVEDMKSLPIVRHGGNGRPVRLGELGEITRQLEAEKTRAFFSENGRPFGKTIDVSIKKVPGADTVELTASIERALEEWQVSYFWPKDIKYSITQNEADQIRDSLYNVFINGLQAMLAVFLIMFVVLTWREGVIAGVSIPLSFCGALVVIWMLGYSLNELVIIGMVLVLGLLVDVFILMMEGLHEEIYTHKKTFGQAVLATIEKYGMPAFAGQLTTILALAPLMAIGGISGKFVRVLPITTIACLVVAFAVALLASVPLSRYFLESVAKKGSLIKETHADRILASVSSTVKTWSLETTLKNSKRAGMWVAGAFFLFVLSMFAASRIPMELYPLSDGLNLGINIELPSATTLEKSQKVADSVGWILQQKPYFESVIKLVGRKSPMASASILSALEPSQSENFIGFSITFVEPENRDKPSYVLMNELRSELKNYLDENVAGATLLVVGEASGPSTGDPISIAISGPDMMQLQTLSIQVQSLLKGVNGTADVRDNLGSVKAEISLKPNREVADFFGLSQQDLASQIRFALSNDVIGTFATLGSEDDLDIRLGLNWKSRAGNGGGPTELEEFSMVRAFTPEGKTVALSSLLNVTISETPASIIHHDGVRSISVLSKLNNSNVNEVTAELEPLLADISKRWPAGYTWSMDGEVKETAETFGSAGAMLVVALIMVFGVLVIVFDSFKQGLILMATMPLALIGTFIGFWVTGLSLSFFAVIGLISLIGIVANNGIVMIDTMNKLLRQGVSITEAAADGAAARLRPILTTSITTVVGLIPLALGSPMYAPLCYAIIFGLVTSTILSLVIVPCLYLLLTDDSQRFKENLD
ncbi:efflux RND transporter permease subunit [Marinomonas profundimaris]|uniref:Acriflavin resistance protein n=1 Tax=Marinomonas profundimaris TaxID=1208321 RepID=W1RZF4_9GAMM|nr:efflux RND transporter permease subunit [Marinomonas profundimaris]ETI61124.1 acriflavin resistance protein [Marinomonas profundimaris]